VRLQHRRHNRGPVYEFAREVEEREAKLAAAAYGLVGLAGLSLLIRTHVVTPMTAPPAMPTA